MLTCARCGSSVALPDDPRSLATSCGRCGSRVDLASMRTLADTATPPQAAAEETLEPGRVLSGCRIEGLLGRGGMASVYKAVQLSLNRPVAIKVLPPALSRNEAFVARFNREAGALAALNHPNLLHVIDRGVQDEICFFVMELVDGTDLQAMIARGKLATADAVRIAVQVCSALDYAHRKGVIHRDIKPGNIMIARDGAVKVTDFGIAHLAGAQEGSFGLTMAGAAMGTVNYMAPEQRVNAAAVDARADLYSLGVVLYEMLTGRLPLGAFHPPSRLNTAVDARLDAVILRALKQDPGDRFATAADLAAALGSPAAPAPAPSSPDVFPAEVIAAPSLFPCPYCKSENRADAKYCLRCGKTLLETCPKCRKPIRAGSKFCDSCGTNMEEFVARLREGLETRLAHADELERERRMSEAIAETDAVLAARGPDLEDLKGAAQDRKRRLLADREKLDAEFAAGQAQFERRDYEAAIARWQSLPAYVANEAIAEARKRIEARDRALQEADAAHAAGRFEEALAAWKRAAELAADSSSFLAKMEEASGKVADGKYAEASRRAAVASAARDPAAAAAAWQEALNWRPGDPDATRGFRKAELLKRGAERDDLIAEGEQARKAGRPGEAVSKWRQAIELKAPEDPSLRAELEEKIKAAEAEDSAEKKKVLVVLGLAGGGVALFLLFLFLVFVVWLIFR